MALVSTLDINTGEIMETKINPRVASNAKYYKSVKGRLTHDRCVLLGEIAKYGRVPKLETCRKYQCDAPMVMKNWRRYEQSMTESGRPISALKKLKIKALVFNLM